MCLSVFLTFHAIKNDPKIKVLIMPRKFNKKILNFDANNIIGGCTRWAQPTWVRQQPQARPGGLWSPHSPLTCLFSPCHHLPLEKFSFALSPVFFLPNQRISISLLEAPFLKLYRGIVAWYVSPPFVQLIFVLVGYILNN